MKTTAWQALRNKYPSEECVLLCEVSDTTGGRNRSLDYMVINLWPSRGLSVIGIEKKSNRNDWLRELKTPAKQESHFKHCDNFYLLTDKEGVAKEAEIPSTWGWMHLTENGRLKIIKIAPKLDPVPIGRSLLCAMLRRAANKDGFVHVDLMNDRINQEVEKRVLAKSTAADRKAADYDALKEKVDAFEARTGINISYQWGGDMAKLGDAVNLLLRGNMKHHIDTLKWAADRTKQTHEDMTKNINELETLLSNNQQLLKQNI